MRELTASRIVGSFFEAAQRGKMIGQANPGVTIKFKPFDPGALPSFDLGETSGTWAESPIMAELYERYKARGLAQIEAGEEPEGISLPFPDALYLIRFKLPGINYNILRATLTDEGTIKVKVYAYTDDPRATFTGIWARLPFGTELFHDDPSIFTDNKFVAKPLPLKGIEVADRLPAVQYADLHMQSHFNFLICACELINMYGAAGNGLADPEAITMGRANGWRVKNDKERIPAPIIIDPTKPWTPRPPVQNPGSGTTQVPHNRRRHQKHKRDMTGVIIKSWWCPTDPNATIKVHGGAEAAGTGPIYEVQL